MLTTVFYMLQVLLCSGIMMGYYWLVLRDKKFHQYNRFYLLAITLLAWVVPLIKIQWKQSVTNNDTIVYELLSAVAMNNTEIEANIHKHWYDISWQLMTTIGYLAVSSLLFTGMLISLFKIYRLLKIYAGKTIGNIFLVITQAKGTPFSFFSFIFWNEAIDIKSESGKQILQHELIHVQQKHSIDKLFMQLVLVFGWFNPFFWAIRKELHMIHEFIADKKCIDDGNAAALAEMLLTAAYPQQKFLLTNPFFFSPIKRRIAMIKNNSNTQFSYLRRLIVLPLLAIVVVLFAFRNAAANNKPISVETVLENSFKQQGRNKADTIILSADTIYKMPKDGKVKIIRASGNDTLETYESTIRNNKNSVNNALIVLNGVVLEKGANTLANIKLNPSHIKQINVLKDSSASVLYGDLGKDGVIEIFTKQPPPSPIGEMVKVEAVQKPSNDDLLFTVATEPASFVGGKEKWIAYLKNNLNLNMVVNKGGPVGKYTVQLSILVDKQGKIGRVKALNDPGYGTAAEAVRVVLKSPKWNPAKQNGILVNSVVKKTITFVVSED